jgi:hypothetical protein
MWESRRDFHTLSFPWPALRPAREDKPSAAEPEARYGRRSRCITRCLRPRIVPRSPSARSGSAISPRPGPADLSICLLRMRSTVPATPRSASSNRKPSRSAHRRLPRNASRSSSASRPAFRPAPLTSLPSRRHSLTNISAFCWRSASAATCLELAATLFYAGI